MTLTSDTDKCRHYACDVDYRNTGVQSLPLKMCWGAFGERGGGGTEGICPPLATFLFVSAYVCHMDLKMPYLVLLCIVFPLSSLAGTEFICLTWTVRHYNHSTSCHMSLLLTPVSFFSSLFVCTLVYLSSNDVLAYLLDDALCVSHVMWHCMYLYAVHVCI